MQLVLFSLLIAVIPMFPTIQTNGQDSMGNAVSPVTYIEVVPASRSTAIAALNDYRNASRSEKGFLSIDSFEQRDRPGHFAILEVWEDSKTFETHVAGLITKQLLDKLETIRLSDYDQRPYRPFSIGGLAAGSGNTKLLFVITHVDTIGAQSDAPGLLRRLAEESRKDPGNLRFDVLQHTTRANHFTVVEAWKDIKAFESHAGATHTRQYRDALHAMSGSPLDERVYDRVQ